MENTQEENARKGEAMLTKFGVIKKIGVYCYNVTIENHNGAVGTISSEDEQLIIIGINEESLEERTEEEHYEDDGFMRSTTYSLVFKEEGWTSDEVMERFNLSEYEIEEILDGENLELDDWDLRGTYYFYECKLSIKELREKRKIDSEPFDADEIISKIASEYVLTPKRKEALFKSIKKLS